MTSYRDTLYTINKHGDRQWVYPTLQKGWYWNRRVIVAVLLMAFYLAMPWMHVQGEQAVFLDIYGRRFVFLGQIFFATDTIFLTMLLGILGFALFFFSAVLGRVWCGWACPETVFLEFLFRPIERFIEGKENERRRRDLGPWNVDKILRKGLKLGIFALIAWVLASTALAYFVGRERLLAMMVGSPFDNFGLFLLTVALMAAMLFQFGWFREQFCTVLCPYARFQSVLLDSNSVIVGYDKARGEPRGKLRPGASEEKKGDCIDCGLCVRVCPTGIDIRNGLQLECIHCTQCVDACDSIMGSIGKPLGLIRYDTEVGFAGQVRRWVRPRVVVYALAIAVFAVALVYKVTFRDLTEFRVVRAQHDAPFQEIADDVISNHFEVSMSNKGRQGSALSFALEDGQGIGVKVVQPVNPFPIPANSVVRMPLFVQVPRSALRGGTLRLTIIGRDGDREIGRQVLTVVGPQGDSPGSGDDD